MWTMLLKAIIAFAGSEIGKEAIKLGAKKLVDSTDNGIDNEILDVFLDSAVKSNRNSMKRNVKNTIMNELTK